MDNLSFNNAIDFVCGGNYGNSPNFLRSLDALKYIESPFLKRIKLLEILDSIPYHTNHTNNYTISVLKTLYSSHLNGTLLTMISDRNDAEYKGVLKNTIPRRCRIDLASPAEASIRAAMAEVEKMEADERLTNAVNFLSKALDSVADFIDKTPKNKG